MTVPASVERIVSIARDLGPLASEVVFIGGAIAPLLHTEARIPRTRPTKDVDGVIASHTYTDSDRIHRELRNLGFRHDRAASGHLHRWIASSGGVFDLVPAGDHTGGSGNPWDVAAIASSASVIIEGVAFRHAAAPAFIAMKVEAFNDRGGGDPLASHDIEDVVALIACRASIVSDVATADQAVRARVRQFASHLIESGAAEELLASHLNNADDVRSTVRIALERINMIGSG